MVIESRVRDTNAYNQYIQKVGPIVEKYSGRYLARGGKVTPLGGGWAPERMIILEFPSEHNVKQWLSSPEYREIAPLREHGAEARAVLLEGVAERT
jgi:uncharacterized protein (DUF1330 family)